MCWSHLHKKRGTAAAMRRSPPGLSCLMGLDLQRKRPLADLTPEDGEAESSPPSPPPSPLSAAMAEIALVVEATPSFKHTTGTLHNPNVECKR